MSISPPMCFFFPKYFILILIAHMCLTGIVWWKATGILGIKLFNYLSDICEFWVPGALKRQSFNPIKKTPIFPYSSWIIVHVVKLVHDLMYSPSSFILVLYSHLLALLVSSLPCPLLLLFLSFLTPHSISYFSSSLFIIY